MQALQNVQNNHAFTLTSLRGVRLWKGFVFEGSRDQVNEVSSAFGTMEHETWTSLEEDGRWILYNLVFSFTFTKGCIKDIHIHLHDLTLTRSYPPNIGLHLPIL